MKVFVFSCRDFDEAEPFAQISKELGIDLGISMEKPTMENLHLANGYDAISIFTISINEEMMAELSSMGIKMISTRTIGYEHIDLEARIDALASGKVGAAGLDVVENEDSMYYYNLENDRFLHQQLATLKSFSNVIVAPHRAFYAESGMRDMVFVAAQHSAGAYRPRQPLARAVA